MERDILRSNYEAKERLSVTSGDDCHEQYGRPGPLTIAMGEVEKLKDYLQNGYRSSNEDIFLDDDGNSAKSYTNQDELITCLMVMKRLMEEAEEESMRLKEEKRVLTQKIGESLNSVNKEMESLRNQLQEQDKRLSELGSVRSASKSNSPFCNGDDNYQKEYGVTAANFMGEKARQIMDALHDKAIELEKENHMLNEEVYVLRNEITKMPCSHCADWKECVNELQLELKRSKDSITILKRERKKSKAEKLELLDQMKQLYATLEDKERELRDFIVNYEQRMKDSEEAITELVAEKDRIQKERWEILRHASETTEHSVTLKNQVDNLEEQLRIKDDELSAARLLIETLRSKSTTLGSSECLTDRPVSDNRLSSVALDDTSCEISTELSAGVSGQDKPADAKIETPPRTSSTPGSLIGDTQYLSLINADSTPHVNHSSRRPRTYHPNSTSDDVFTNFSRNDDIVIPRPLSSRRRRTLSSAFSKVFQKGLTESNNPQGQETSLDGWRTGVDESTINKWEVWDQMQKEPMSKWKADAVIVWLEVECCMSMYSAKCYENVKSGKVLLELSDQELASALNITNAMHKQKLRLAIDDHKHPEKRNPRLSKLDHVWVSYTFLRDLGLSPYAPIFENNLVDGRMLNQVSKKDLEKHLGILKKSHQASFMHGLELLKMFNFDKDALHLRRSNCIDTNIDLIVWTNERVIKWVSSIDLQEYTEALQDSGIHGAHMVLDSNFGTDTFAAVLQIPSEKQMVLKHLASELTTLLNTARNSPSLPSHVKWNKGRKPIGRSFSLKWHRKGSGDNSKQRRISTSKSSGTLPASSGKSGENSTSGTDKGGRKATLL